MRRLTSPEEVRDAVFARAAREGWRPGALDHISFFAVDGTRFFAGDLNRKTISSMYFLKYSKDYVYSGGWIVDKKHRGKGYGIKTLNAAYASIKESYNLAGDATFEIMPFHAAHSGTIPQWCMQCFDISAHEAAKTSAKMNNLKGTTIVPPSKDLFPLLLEYDTHVHVFPRPLFLETWVFAPNCHCSVAVDDDSGGVAGYGVVRTTLGEGRGWRIGPLFADSSAIARNLYRDLCVKVAREDPVGEITLDVSHGRGFSPDSLGLVSELQGRPTFQMMRIYKYGVPPNMPLHKIYVMT